MQRKGEDNRARGHGLSNRRLRHPAETKKPPFEVAYDIAYCLFLFGFNMVPGAGLEPAQPYSRGILNPLCLPISPPGQGVTGGASRSRTEVHGFAIRCIATLPTRLKLMCRQVNLTCESGAGNETRTRDPDLGKVVLYQLSYSRALYR